MCSVIGSLQCFLISICHDNRNLQLQYVLILTGHDNGSLQYVLITICDDNGIVAVYPDINML